MSSGALHSDHINYLVLRYLQEAGHENAATALYRDWHRPRDYRDPETLPFAPTVGRNELISVIQEGLRFDELVSRVGREQRRFRWTLDHDPLENGNAPSRPSSSGKRKPRPIPQPMRAPDEFPTPAPKRQRRSEGPDTVHVNGDRDAMDIDATSASPEGEDEPEDASPAVGSEADLIDIQERYDSVQTQTDCKARTITRAMYWKVENPGSSVLHSIYSPSLDAERTRALFIAGDTLCRFYKVPDSADDLHKIEYANYPRLPAKFVVTAATWHPNGLIATCAVDNVNVPKDSREASVQSVVNHSQEFGSSAYPPGPALIQSPGIVICLRYSPKGDYLLVVRTNLDSGSIQVWSPPNYKSENYALEQEPVAWRVFEHQLLDACWVSDDTFVLSGNGGLSSMYRVDPTPNGVGVMTAEDAMVQGLREQRSTIVTLQDTWDKVRYDQQLNVVVFIATESQKLLSLPLTLDDSADRKDVDAVVELPGRLTAAAFQPATDVTESALLAATFEEGFSVVYRIRQTPESAARCEELARLQMEEGPALALAWSTNGNYLAVGGTDLVEIWSQDDFTRKNGTTAHEPSVIWRPEPPVSELDGQDGNVNGDAHEIVEPSLSWSADGESLAFTADRQLAVIRFVPPLNSTVSTTTTDTIEVNGKASPSS